MERKSLPAALIPEEGYELLDQYAQTHKMSLSEAIRSILQSSLELKVFAHKEDLQSYFQINAWGGNRKYSAEKAELLNDVYTGLDEAITGKTIPASQMMAALDDDE
jgi:hypothetical protein